MTKPKETNSAPDWERIELDYRAGVKSLREIGGENGVSHVAVRKRAKRDGWDRDLSARIKAKAEALVSKEAVSSEVSTERAVTEQAIVEANAEAIKQVRMAHRRDIRRARAQANRLLEELEHTGEHIDLIEQLETMVAADLGADQDPKAVEKRAAALQKVLELPTRTGVMKMLAETMTKLIALEREAYGIGKGSGREDDHDKEDPLTALLKSIDGAGTGLPRHATPV